MLIIVPSRLGIYEVRHVVLSIGTSSDWLIGNYSGAAPDCEYYFFGMFLLFWKTKLDFTSLGEKSPWTHNTARQVTPLYGYNSKKDILIPLRYVCRDWCCSESSPENALYMASRSLSYCKSGKTRWMDVKPVLEVDISDLSQDNLVLCDIPTSLQLYLCCDSRFFRAVPNTAILCGYAGKVCVCVSVYICAHIYLYVQSRILSTELWSKHLPLISPTFLTTEAGNPIMNTLFIIQ